MLGLDFQPQISRAFFALATWAIDDPQVLRLVISVNMVVATTALQRLLSLPTMSSMG